MQYLVRTSASRKRSVRLILASNHLLQRSALQQIIVYAWSAPTSTPWRTCTSFSLLLGCTASPSHEVNSCLNWNERPTSTFVFERSDGVGAHAGAEESFLGVADAPEIALEGSLFVRRTGRGVGGTRAPSIGTCGRHGHGALWTWWWSSRRTVAREQHRSHRRCCFAISETNPAPGIHLQRVWRTKQTPGQSKGHAARNRHRKMCTVREPSQDRGPSAALPGIPPEGSLAWNRLHPGQGRTARKPCQLKVQAMAHLVGWLRTLRAISEVVKVAQVCNRENCKAREMDVGGLHLFCRTRSRVRLLLYDM